MKKAFIKTICLVFAIIMSALPLFACTVGGAKETEATTNVHTVKFNSNGGTYIPDVEVRNGQKISEPNPPTRENYIFLYWENNNRRWMFSSKEITEDITLSALWISAADLFNIVPTENSDELLISGFATQKNIYNLAIPEKINGKTVVGITDNAFESIHEQHAEHLIIPATVTSVGKESFKKVKSVHIKLLGTINSLDVSSFEECTTLETLKLGEGLTSIPYRCFFGASALVTVDIPKGVTIIEENAFASCTDMQTVVLPSTLSSIEDSAFLDCEKLAVVFFNGTKEQFDAIKINGNNSELLGAKTYFYSETEPTESGDYWHYDKSNTPVLW